MWSDLAGWRGAGSMVRFVSPAALSSSGPRDTWWRMVVFVACWSGRIPAKSQRRGGYHVAMMF